MRLSIDLAPEQVKEIQRQVGGGDVSSNVHLQRVLSKNPHTPKTHGVIITGTTQEIYASTFPYPPGPFTVVMNDGHGSSYDSLSSLFKAWEIVPL